MYLCVCVTRERERERERRKRKREYMYVWEKAERNGVLGIIVHNLRYHNTYMYIGTYVLDILNIGKN